MYLTGSIIRVNGDPVIITDLAPHNKGVYRIYYIQLEDYFKDERDIGIITTDSKNIDLSPVELGFCNFKINGEHNTFYTYRSPQRMWKIGLHLNNFMINSLEPLEFFFENSRILYSKSLEDTIKNKYPSFDECIIKIHKPHIKSIAFSRDFALSSDRIYYKLFGTVGERDVNNNKFGYMTNSNSCSKS